MNNEILHKIKEKIDSRWSFQPLLFLSEETELLHQTIENIIQDLFSHYHVDKNCFYKLTDNGEKIKITQMRELIMKGNMRSQFQFQIFLIENISRATLESANSALKFFEEPGEGNIIFLTNTQEGGILDTILSRVQTIHIKSERKKSKNEFYYSLIDEYIHKKNLNLIKYFFNDKKLEKWEYVDFLSTFLLYIKENLIFTELAEQIENSLNLIQKNNALPKYEIDRLLLKI